MLVCCAGIVPGPGLGPKEGSRMADWTSFGGTPGGGAP